MSLRFYFGPSGAGKSHMLYQEIIERSEREPERSFFLIVPDQFTMQTQKDIVMRHPRRGIMNIDVLSFGRLSHRVFEETGTAGTPVLDDTGKSLVLRKVAQGLLEELPVIGANLKKLGYIQEVKSAISEFMQYGILPEDMERLTDFAKGRGQLYYKLKDLGLMYKSFTDYIRQRYVTTEETLGLLASRITESELLKDSIVVFDGFTGFTPVQNQVIRALLAHCREVIVTVLLGEKEDPFLQDGEQKLFYLSKKTAVTLQRLAEETGAGRGKDVFLTGEKNARFAESPELAHLERQLFRYPMTACDKPCKNIRVIEAVNPREEVRQTALAIRRLVREENYCYRDIAVIAGDLGSYDVYIEEEFAKFNIPVFLDKTHGILLSPMIEYIRSALQAVRQNFSYEAMFHFLRSGLSGLPEEGIDRLENYVLAAGIKGKKAWTSLFTRQSRQMRERGEEKAMEELACLNALREETVAQLAPLMEVQRTARDHVRALYQFLVQNKVQEKCFRYERYFAQQNDLEREREYAQIYRLVIGLLDQIDELLAQETMGREEFADILDAGFAEIEVGILPQNVDKVVAGDMERTRLNQVRALFLLGVNDGNIPAAGTGGGIISDIDREFLAASDFELAPTPRQKMYIQRLYLYMNMTKTSVFLTLSYTRSTNDGKARKPSYLIAVMYQLFPDLRVERALPETVSETGPKPGPGTGSGAESEIKIGAKPDMQIQTLESPQDGMMLLAERLRQYAAGRLPLEEEQTLAALYDAYDFGQIEEQESEQAAMRQSPMLPAALQQASMPQVAWQRILQLVSDQAFASYEGGKLSREVASLLYGKILLSSVSRLERFAACAYAHFLQYGMSLKEREEYSFAGADMGNIFHSVLEQFAEALSARGLSWFDFSGEEAEELLSEALESCAAQYGETVLFSSARNAYIVTRMRRILNRTVKTLQYQLKKGVFEPRDFEVSFSQVEDLEAVNIVLGQEERMKLRGRIDRIDTYETPDKVYVKVIDYKSGSKNFDIVSLYYGLQLQLVVYLSAAEGLMKKRNPGREVVPAAVLYYHVSDPMVREEGEALTAEEVQQRLRKELSMTGVVNYEEELPDLMDRAFTGRSDVIPVERKKDGSLSARSHVADTRQFHQMSEFVNQKIKELGRSIIEGDIQINPYERGEGSAKTQACTYCAYKAVCGFDERIEGYKMRSLKADRAQAEAAIFAQEDTAPEL